MEYNFPRYRKIQNQSCFFFPHLGSCFYSPPPTPGRLLLPLLGVMKVLSAAVDLLRLGLALHCDMAERLGVAPLKCQTDPHYFASSALSRSAVSAELSPVSSGPLGPPVQINLPLN